MKYAEIKPNDIANGDGIGVSFFVQGCPHHCYKCFNPETWDFNGGKEFTQDTLDFIIDSIKANGINRHLSILGGEPLCDENLFLTDLVITAVKEKYPDIKIYLWTGYTYEALQERKSPHLKHILSMVNVLIDGPFILAERDITLPLRGSRNQQVRELR